FMQQHTIFGIFVIHSMILCSLAEKGWNPFADEAPSSFHVYVDDGWYDVVTINYDRKWVERYNLSRQYKGQDTWELIGSGKQRSRWSVGFSILRGFTPFRECFSYKVSLRLISKHELESVSNEVCIGPGSKSAEQVKFWIFTTILCGLIAVLFTVAIRHEVRREAIFAERKPTPIVIVPSDVRIQTGTGSKEATEGDSQRNSAAAQQTVVRVPSSTALRADHA
uniref:Cytochrome b5 heme-binding domain-containing protein n=1 Tax=Haemonchus contortus TaxID=6289 RepID=A0A7I4XWZ4_HAECO